MGQQTVQGSTDAPDQAVAMQASEQLEPRDKELAPNPPSPDGTPAPTVMRDFRVLIVEDNPHVSQVLTFAVHRMFRSRQDINVTIDVTEDPLQAMAFLHENSFDLVIADLNLPMMSGTELKEHGKSAAFILTSAGGATARHEAAMAGVSFFLPKPFRAVEVESIIKRSCHV